MLKLRAIALMSLLIVAVAMGCSSSDQAAVDKEVSTTLPATTAPTATSTPEPVLTDTPVMEPTTAPVPTPTSEPTATSVPVPAPVPTPEPTVTPADTAKDEVVDEGCEGLRELLRIVPSKLKGNLILVVSSGQDEKCSRESTSLFEEGVIFSVNGTLVVADPATPTPFPTYIFQTPTSESTLT